MKRAGFTLIEVLVVAGIIAVLVGITIPAVSMFMARGQATKCLGNLSQIGAGLQLYLNDNDMVMPELLAGRKSKADDGPVIEEVLAEYLPNADVFICPADREIGAASGTSYYWNVALNGQRIGSLNFLQLVDSLQRIPVMSDKEGWHRYDKQKVNFLYADGHVTKDLQLFTEE